LFNDAIAATIIYAGFIHISGILVGSGHVHQTGGFFYT
jgi:hypothetical protein